MGRLCNYDEGYTKENAREIGFCGTCRIANCEYSRLRNNYHPKVVMAMSPNDYIKIIEEKDVEIKRLRKIVAEINENIRVVGKQNTSLKRRCDRYEKILTEMHVNNPRLKVAGLRPLVVKPVID